MNTTPERNRRRLAATVGGMALAMLLALPAPSRADQPLPIPELLANGSFVDQVSMTLRNKVLGRQTNAVQMSNAASLFVLRVTIPAGGIAPWHNHEGVGFLVNTGPGTLTNYVGDSCEPRFFFPGDAFIDPGYGELHAVRNDTDEDIVLLITFVSTEGPPVLPGTAPADCGGVLDPH
jgi:quercetin dioxygenase-like cupin family protein